MPRPKSLQNTSSGRPYASTSNYDQQSLTPRTPHSRAGRGTESWYKPRDIHDEENDLYHRDTKNEHDLQNEPLLKSTTDATFPHRRETFGFQDTGRGRRRSKSRLDFGKLVSRLPLLLGVFVALVLFVLLVLSLRRPDVLMDAIGHKEGMFDENNDVEQVAPESEQPLTPPSNHGMEHSTIISYANYSRFPLTPMEFLTECYNWFAGMKGTMPPYWFVPPGGAMDVVHKEDDLSTADSHLPEMETKRTCSSTITYMLDGYVGLAADLALMAQVAALARERNRTFFVNDQYWNRGKWSDYFQDVRDLQPGPEPGCLPSPPEELVACPRVARHWVINSRTARFHLGHMFSDAYEDAYGRFLRRHKPIYDQAAESFAQTIRPNAEIATLIRTARQEISSKVQTRPSIADSQSFDRGTYMTVHVRRGDRKADTFPYRGNYVPLEEYASSATDTWTRLSNLSTVERPVVWLATDAPEVVGHFSTILREIVGTNDGAGVVILSLSKSSHDELRNLASREAYVQKKFDALSEDERIRLTRGAVVDLALVGGLWTWEDEASPLASICTISSNFCKIAATGLGWERAFGFDTESLRDNPNAQASSNKERQRWIDIDSRGLIEPEWRAFQLF